MPSERTSSAGIVGRRLGRRLTQLYAGLVLYGFSMALLIESGLGLNPWDVFHQGITRHIPLTIGLVTIAVGAIILLAWIPLRQRIGIGTVSNVVVIGLVVDASLWLLPAPDHLAIGIIFMVTGIVGNAAATAAYVGAGLGPGPRDGLMTGLVAQTGRSVRVIRTIIEVSVLGVGWLLGGTVGVGTVLYAMAIGPLVHALLPRLTVVFLASPPVPAGPAASASAVTDPAASASVATDPATAVSAVRDGTPPAPPQ